MQLATHTPKVTLPASDLARARQFYEQVLGFQVLEDRPQEEAVIYLCGQAEVLLYHSAFAGTNKATAATWIVDDVDGAVAELRAAGVTFQTFDLPGATWEDGVAVFTDGDSTAKAAWFTDPEGNIISVGNPMP